MELQTEGACAMNESSDNLKSDNCKEVITPFIDYSAFAEVAASHMN